MKNEELDALIAEKVMGIDLSMTADEKLIKYIKSKMRMTGPQGFRIDGFEERFFPPDGEKIVGAEFPDWNDRYYWWIGKKIFEKIENDIPDYKKIPEPYSTTWEGMGLVVEKLFKMGFYPDIISTHHGIHGLEWRCELHTANDKGHPNAPYRAHAYKPPYAVCLAALEAVGFKF